MAVFDWTHSGTGDWTTAGNWVLLLGTPNPGTPPPGTGDFAFFADAGASYTVNVTTSVDVDEIAIIPTTSTANFVISGSLTTNVLAYSAPLTIGMTVEDGGLLHVIDLLVAPFGDPTQTITISGKGTTGGQVELGDLFDTNVTFAFDNTSTSSLNVGVIRFDGVTTFSPDTFFHPQITNVAWGNEFVVSGARFIGDTVNYDGTSLEVIDTDGDDGLGNSPGEVVFTMANVSAAPLTKFAIVGSDTIEAVPVCYARGTMIRTPAGELPVEKLRPGKQVITLVDGQEVPQTVTWLGHRRIDLTAHPRPETVAPIRIERDAFADNMPHRDLLVSPDHAIFVDGKLICARQLVNGTTIRQELDWTAVDYYHVELDQHAILLAEGLPAESYIDTGNSGFFANSGAAPGAAPGPDGRD